MNETYEAASRGVIDAIVAPLETLTGFNFADVTSSITIPILRFTTSNITVMNLKKWNSLPKDIQDLFTKVAEEMPDAFGKAWWYSDIIAVDYFVKKKGGKLIDPPPQDYSLWADPLKTIADEYIARASAAGLPGKDYVKYLQEGSKNWGKRQTVDSKACIAWVEKELVPLK
jgi:TRAP-type C4-dicarboxylate transport system substrate-binding protein